MIIRGLGPSLPVSGPLAQPVLQLFDRHGASIATNDDWKSTQRAEILATGFAPRNDEESAIIMTLSPGSYTAILTGDTQAVGRRTTTSTGVGQIEIYDLSPSANSQLAIMSSFSFAGTGETAMDGDFTVGGGEGKTKVLLRVLGPSIEGGTLQDPTLELDNANGTQIFFNDNWQDSQKAAILATSLAPTNPKEPAIVANLDPGHYLALVRGKTAAGGSASGYARVEVYQLGSTAPTPTATPTPTPTPSATPTPTPGAAQMVSPTPGSTFTSSSVTFNWTAGSATAFGFFVGSSPNMADIYNSGVIHSLSATVTNMPTDGRTIYVNLASQVNGSWVLNRYTYTASKR